MITLAVTILLIVLFLVLTRKQRSEYYEEGIGPSDIEMGPSEDAPVRPRSLVHKIKKGIKKIEKKRTQDVELHDLFLKQIDMKAAKKQGEQDEVKEDIKVGVKDELEFIKKYTNAIKDKIYENKTLPEDETYDIVAESAHDALRADINEQLVVKGKEYQKRQDEELALQTEQRRKMDQEVSDTRNVKTDLKTGIESLNVFESQITSDVEAIEAGELPTTDLGQDVLMSRGDEAITTSTPYTQNMASIFASASLAPDGGWNDGQVAPSELGADDIETPTPPEDKPEKLIQFSEVGNVFEDYYAIQDPNGYWSQHGHKPIDPDTGEWRREKVQMKISCGPHLDHGYTDLRDSSEWENSKKAAFNLLSVFGMGQSTDKPFEGPGGWRRDSRYAKHFYSRPFITWGGGGMVLDDKGDACLPPPGGGAYGKAWPATFEECADACEKNDKCSAFSIDPIFDSETGAYSRSLSKDEGKPFMSLTAGPDKIGDTPNAFKNKYWCKLQKYGARRFDIGTFSGETIFAKYEDGYLKDPLIKEHISKKIDANTSDIAGQGDFAHPKFPRTCDESPLRSEVAKFDGFETRWFTGEQSRSGRDHSRASGLGVYRRHENQYAISDKLRSELPKHVLDTYALPADSARFTNASWVYPDVGGACKNGGKNELTAFPGKFRTDDEADPNTQIPIGCPMQFISTNKWNRGGGRGTDMETVNGGWRESRDEAKPNPFHLGWVNHGVGEGSNVIRNKIRSGTDDRYGYSTYNKNLSDTPLVGDDYRSLVLPGKTAIPNCPDGYAVRTENQPYCDPDTLSLSTPFAKCEPILKQGGCVAKESKHQNICSSLTERKCLTTPIDGDQLGMPKLDTQTSLSKLQGGLFPDGREYGPWSELEEITNPFWTQSINGKMSSEVCEWNPHTFYDGQVSRTAEYDGKKFWILHKRGQRGTWSVGQPSNFEFTAPKWNWDTGGYDPTYKDWAKFFDTKGKIVLYNIDRTVNQDAVKYQAAVLEKMGGDFKPTEIPVIYFEMEEIDKSSKDLAERAALGFFGDDVE
jgi:hypothetical protein